VPLLSTERKNMKGVQVMCFEKSRTGKTDELRRLLHKIRMEEKGKILPLSYFPPHNLLPGCYVPA
jgi:hypothetical protein